MPSRTPSATLEDARDRFIAEWGGLGPAWGVNRTMSQIHALLMVSPESMNTDQIMGALEIRSVFMDSGLTISRAWI